MRDQLQKLIGLRMFIPNDWKTAALRNHFDSNDFSLTHQLLEHNILNNQKR